MTGTWLTSFPAVLLSIGLSYEGARRWRRRAARAPPREDAWRFGSWIVRPWMAWAVFNLFNRANRARGFNNPRTFPFYANLWRDDETFREAVRRLAGAPEVWGWTAAVALAGAGLAWLAHRAGSLEGASRRRIAVLLAAGYALAVAFHLSAACLPDGARSDDRTPGSLLAPWYEAGNTMLYAMPLIEGADHYFRHFVEFQPRLRPTIHALSHPPGASFSLYAIARLWRTGPDIRLPATKLRYALGLTTFSALSFFVLYALGRSMFGSAAVGLSAAIAWAAMPGTAAYITFSQDGLYAVFFNLALWLMWRCATSRDRPWATAAALGAVFFVLTLLNYSWCIATTMFAAFMAVRARAERWRPREAVLRTARPLAVMALLLALFLWHYRLDYLEMYRTARRYVDEWYRYAGPYQWILALVGGQMELLTMAGSVACSAVVAGALRLRRTHLADPRVQLALVVVAVYAIPILIGPNPLKMEVARCWPWILTVPLLLAIDRILRGPRRRLFVAGTVAVSATTYWAMRLFLNFGA